MSRKIVEVKTVSAAGGKMNLFDEVINNLLAEGWEIYGGIIMSEDYFPMQQMVKYGDAVKSSTLDDLVSAIRDAHHKITYLHNFIASMNLPPNTKRRIPGFE